MEDGSVYPQHIVGGPQELQVCLLEGPAVAAAAVKNNWPEGKPRSADLLLAAPDMLEALQIIIGDIEQSPRHFTPAEKVAIARRAINKATGASHV